MIAPFFEGMIDLHLYIFYDLTTQAKYFGLFAGSHKRPDISFNGAYQGLHQVAVGDELEGYFFDGLFGFILHRIKKHTLEIHVGLVLRNSLELQLHRTVLYRDLLIKLFNHRYLDTKSRTNNALVAAKHGYNANITLVNGKQPA